MVSGRDIPIDKIYDTIGPFINILICRLDLEGKNSAEILKAMQDEYLTGLSHQHTSLSSIQNALGLSRISLFNTVMSVQRLPSDKSQPLLSLDVVSEVDPSEVCTHFRIKSFY